MSVLLPLQVCIYHQTPPTQTPPTLMSSPRVAGTVLYKCPSMLCCTDIILISVAFHISLTDLICNSVAGRTPSPWLPLPDNAGSNDLGGTFEAAAAGAGERRHATQTPTVSTAVTTTTEAEKRCLKERRRTRWNINDGTTPDVTS